MTWLRKQAWARYLYRAVLPRPHEPALVQICENLGFPRTPAWNKSRVAETLGEGGCHSMDLPSIDMPGINIVGYIRGQFGLGESARAYASALIQCGVPVSLYDVDLDLPHARNDDSMEQWIRDDLPHKTSLFFVNPDFWQAAMDKIGRKRLEGHHLIACWFWELEQIPRDWKLAVEDVDEFMASTSFISQAMCRATDKPVMHVPYPLMSVRDSGLQRGDFGLEHGRFVFLVSFDFNSWIMRKNPFAAIDAFTAAFGDARDDVCLLIKTSNGFRYPDKLRALLEAAVEDHRIIVRDDVIERDHMHALQRCCDAYVSLHRSEGLGLGMAECMAQGKPVIATRWSGNMDFMTDENSCLVDFKRVTVGDGEYPHQPGSEWAEADVAQAAAWMRRLADDREFARTVGARAREHVARVMNCNAAAASLLQRLRLVGRKAASASAAG